MKNIRMVVALITRDNDYQAEQAASALEAASRLGVKVDVVYAGNDAVDQSQQLVKIIQDRSQRPDSILVEPVGTAMPQVAKAAVAAGIGWGVLNREADYLSQLRQCGVPAFAVTIDQEEVGRIQGRQLAALNAKGNVLYVEGPSSTSTAILRTRGMLSTKPAGIEMKVLKGDWSEGSALRAVKSWLTLSTSRQLAIQAVVCQNDAMAMGARKALMDLGEADHDRWLAVPFLGCDGVGKTGQEWVRSGRLRATIVTPPTAGLAVELIVKAIRSGQMPPERTFSSPRSLPAIADLGAMAARA